jgi:hypothetical protein
MRNLQICILENKVIEIDYDFLDGEGNPTIVEYGIESLGEYTETGEQ